MKFAQIDAKRVAAEMMNPELYKERVNEGYAPELEIKDPYYRIK